MRAITTALPKRTHRVFEHKYTTHLLPGYRQTLHKRARAKFGEFVPAPTLVVPANRLRCG